MPAIGDKGLAAVEQVAAVRLLDRGGLDALQVRAGCRLAHGNRAHHLATGQLGQVPGFLLGRTVVQDVRRHDFAVQPEADTGEAAAGQLLHLDHRIQLVRLGAAVFLRHGHAQKAVLAGLVPHLAGDIALLFPVCMKRGDFLFHEAAEAVAERFVVRGEQGAFDHGVS